MGRTDGRIRRGAALSVQEHRPLDQVPALGVETTQIIITIAALVIGWSVLIMIYNFVVSARKQERAATNPWGSRSPEWLIPYPVPEFNYDVPFEVVGDPYDYGLEGANYTQLAPTPAVGD